MGAQGANQAAAAAKLGYPTSFYGQARRRTPAAPLRALLGHSCHARCPCRTPSSRGGRPQVGTDQFTEALPQHLRDTGCEMRLLRQVGGPTGTAVILLQPDGAPGTLGRFHQAERLRPWHGPLPRRWLHARHA